MGTVLCDFDGCVLVDFLPNKVTVNAVPYVQKLRRAHRDKDPIKRQFIPQHNSVRYPTTHLTMGEIGN
jgi:hypothetical protein